VHDGDLVGDGFDGGQVVGDVKRGDAGVLNGLFDRRQHVNLGGHIQRRRARPGLQFLHCRANSVTGGKSIYSDGVAVANAFRERDPEGFRLLSEVAIPFYCEHGTYDMRSRQTVIALDARACLKDPAIVPIDNNMARFYGRTAYDLAFGGIAARRRGISITQGRSCQR
jgi:hypothetical protein